MCGFVGFIDKDFISNREKTLNKISELITHRGPDDYGIYRNDELDFCMGFRRLSILELSEAGHQPMHSKDSRYVLCFNGEIYNHKALKIKLENQFGSLPWKGNSDSEVLLACIQQFGIYKTLEELVGMFAISLLDKKENKLYLARDRFGEKPLYYGRVNKSFLFASELISIRNYDNFNNQFSEEAINYFLNYSYVPSPLSIYKDIYKVDAGEVIAINVNNGSIISKDKFWDANKIIHKAKNNPVTDYKDAIDMIEKSLRESLKLQMKADVPLGAFLSGGIDSSLITALMQDMSVNPIRTFTVGFDDSDYDESPFAAEVAKHLGTDHTKINVSEKEALEVIPRLANYYSEPFADSSQIPTFLVSKVAKSKVTVALSGDGGDELFGGYNRYLWGDRIWNKIAFMPFSLRKSLGKLILATPNQIFARTENLINFRNPSKGVSFLSDKARKLAKKLIFIESDLSLYQSLSAEWNSLEKLTANNAENSQFPFQNHERLDFLSYKENMMLWDITSYLKDDILVKVDRAAMANSLETRAPFLDHRLAECVFRLPEEFLIRDGLGKIPLREILYKYVPKPIIDRPKSGFGIPVGRWITTELRDWAESLLSVENIECQGLLNSIEVSMLWNDHKQGIEDNTVKLWNILMLSQWVNENH